MTARTVHPAWLYERNNDPYGTPPKHPFWETVTFEKVGTHKVFERGGRWYAYDTRYNAWWNFATQAEALERAKGPAVDVWA